MGAWSNLDVDDLIRSFERFNVAVGGVRRSLFAIFWPIHFQIADHHVGHIFAETSLDGIFDVRPLVDQFIPCDSNWIQWI